MRGHAVADDHDRAVDLGPGVIAVVEALAGRLRMMSGTARMPVSGPHSGDAGQRPSAAPRSIRGDGVVTDPGAPAPPGGGACRVVRTLKDGYWDRTELVAREDGSLRVRKSSKGDAPPGPWGVAALRQEMPTCRRCPPGPRRLPTGIGRLGRQRRGPSPVSGTKCPSTATRGRGGARAPGGDCPRRNRPDSGRAGGDRARAGSSGAVRGKPAARAHLLSVVAHALGALEADRRSARLVRADQSG